MRSLGIVMVLFLVACAPTTEPPAPEPAPSAAQRDAEQLQASFTNLEEAMDAGWAMKCTFSYKGNPAQVTIKGEQFHTIAKDQGQVVHSMDTGDRIYVWPESEQQGVYVNKGDLEDIEDKHQYGIFDVEEELDLDCERVTITGGLFTPPREKEFMDLKVLMEQLVEEMF